MRVTRLEHRFVDEIPVDLADGVLYISMRSEVAVHRCASGCRLDVVTPLGKGQWSLFFDGAVTLRPSIGNWDYECESHYVITRDQVLWIEPWQRGWPTTQRPTLEPRPEGLLKRLFRWPPRGG